MDEMEQIKDLAFTGVDILANDINQHCADLAENYCGDTHCVACLANALYTAGYRKQSEWISVEERLPEDEKEVLCYYGFDRGDGDLGMMFTGVLSYFCFDPSPHWQHAYIGLTVTHWMPLPEPPKMKGGAE